MHQAMLRSVLPMYRAAAMVSLRRGALRAFHASINRPSSRSLLASATVRRATIPCARRGFCDGPKPEEVLANKLKEGE